MDVGLEEEQGWLVERQTWESGSSHVQNASPGNSHFAAQ